MKYRDLYRHGAEQLTACGVPEAQLTARLLLEHVCGTSRNDLLSHPEREVEASLEAAYERLLQKRGERIPLQQLTGEQEFMGLAFLVNEHVLAPRQDTECLVEELLIHVEDGSRVLDMCTGSGCILLSLMRYKNEIAGVGADISEKALALARENAERLAVAAEFICSDLFTDIKGEFDVIVSNPPYIPTGVIGTLEPEVKEHEPLLALDGGADGLSFYRRLIAEAPSFLARFGRLFLEIGHDQGEAVCALMRAHGYENVRLSRDLAGLDRVVAGELRR